MLQFLDLGDTAELKGFETLEAYGFLALVSLITYGLIWLTVNCVGSADDDNDDGH